jgi:hypothetical protein
VDVEIEVSDNLCMRKPWGSRAGQGKIAFKATIGAEEATNEQSVIYFNFPLSIENPVDRLEYPALQSNSEEM